MTESAQCFKPVKPKAIYISKYISLKENAALSLQNSNIKSIQEKPEVYSDILISNLDKTFKRAAIKFISKKTKRKRFRPNISNLSREASKNKIINAQSLGLKEIAKKVNEIIEESKNSAYKFVTQEILKEVDLDEHDKKNLRRRIYDALNVINAVNNPHPLHHEEDEIQNCNLQVVSYFTINYVRSI